ncbi:MAG: transposase zinc-binding domain-containing protein [Planctomycetia bacterium]|nr:transposase zinc-binding domain-containing protein [Planctomycetia bacterium]
MPVAAFVEEEFRGYLTCGLLCFGFARALCTQCTQTFVVAFSCKRRGVCPSYNARHYDVGGHGKPQASDFKPEEAGTKACSPLCF